MLTDPAKVGAALSDPLSREIVEPLPIVRFDPFVSVPLVSVSVLVTVAPAFRVTPLLLLMVTEPKLVALPEKLCAELPLKVSLLPL